MTNLVTSPDDHGDKKLHWRIALDTLRDSVDVIGDFPFSPGEAHFDKPTLFIKGETSKYIKLRPCTSTGKSS